jgi:anhydro-N-acetylmuramic acid kinase
MCTKKDADTHRSSLMSTDDSGVNDVSLETQYMNRLLRLQAKKSKLIIGLMSGTSVDGIDAVLLRVRGNGVHTAYRQLAFITQPYPRDVRQLIIRNSIAGSSSVEEITRLNFLLGELFADAAACVVESAGYSLSNVDLIGSHGQTIHHLPNIWRFAGKRIRATLQIGDPSVIAKRTGVPTVGDFRVGDVGLGGQGAPLVPYLDFLLFRSAAKARGLLNIGGIANITILPKNCKLEDVQAFDTGPGNMVVDAVVNRLYHKPFDRDGKLAMRGRTSGSLLRRLADHPFVRKRPPKSTGREEFGEKFVNRVLQLGSSLTTQDLLATVAELTPYCVHENYVRFIEKKVKLDELVVSGGGAQNRAIMAGLQKYFRPVPVRTIEEYGVSSDAKEAVCFALLANETISGNPGNVPAVTGAKERTLLGKICL